MSFSERIGKTSVRTALQVASMDDLLKNRLWNLILESFLYLLPTYGGNSLSERQWVCKVLWTEFFSRRIDLMPQYETNAQKIAPHTDGVIEVLRDWYFGNAAWFNIYDLIEFMAVLDIKRFNTGFVTACNAALKLEVSGYRIVDAQVVQITSEEEIAAIEEALQSSDGLKSVNLHLSTALELLSNRLEPDYRNSIKESISAVEALCKIIVGDEKAPFATALAIIESKFAVHGSLKEAYKKIYGYTSDADGIRHAMLEDGVPVEFEDAKFILVSCSAFINYLKAKLKL